ncbi:endonuclease/exonuclease/phosphatase family protein [Streptomyces sp. HNM0575]|uniref:endonuclease/exonuclease/phosphatase family protein n=1 Tax=Streptomyces sp. HNM0575 TaxID=2716338 RepID=UPI00145E704B|nr:endonuclease/exonuclease/phosphatase family protein [Streptomyces sp. HNM0575]NLU76467.1 endonuclease/exonuclease/phosphatase family protein [Streptomyces sp. HNM0575]
MANTVVRRYRAADGRGTYRRGRRWALLSCGVLLALLFVLLVVRLTGLDAGTALAVPVVLFPYAAVLSVLVLTTVIAVPALRSPRLAIVAALLTAAHMALLIPRFVPHHRQHIPAHATELRVATLNTHVGQADARALARLVKSERIDVLAVQELPSAGIAALAGAGLDKALPYQELHPENDSSLYSRIPLTHGGPLKADTAWPQTTAQVTVGGRIVSLVAVHTYYPLGDAKRWTRDMEALASVAHGSGPDAVFLGDFNASPDHAPMRELLTSGGLADTHAELGHGWPRTWPAGKGLVPPLVQLDHVLHGSGLAGISVGERTIPGTDHRAIIARLALLPSRERAGSARRPSATTTPPNTP